MKRDIRRWRGLKSLVHDAVDVTTDLVDLGHESTMRAVRGITDHVEPLREPVRVADGIRRISTRGLLTTIKVVNRAVEVVTNAALDVAERTYAEPGDAKSAVALPIPSAATTTRPARHLSSLTSTPPSSARL